MQFYQSHCSFKSIKKNNWSLPTVSERIFVKKTRWEFCFLSEKCSTLMEYTTPKMIEYRLLIAKMPTIRVVFVNDTNLYKNWCFGWMFVPKASLHYWYSKNGQLLTIGTSEKYFQRLSNRETRCSVTTGLVSKTLSSHTPMKNLDHCVRIIFLRLSERIFGGRIVLIWIHWITAYRTN